ncbi:neuropeptide Y receptor type 4-2-like [Gastrophryne carolinensis]
MDGMTSHSFLNSNFSTDLYLFNSLKNQCQHVPDITPFLGTSYSLITVLCLLGNSSLIYVLCRGKKKANVTHILIANLAFSDILIGIFCLPFTVVYTQMDHWIFGRCLCKITNFVMCASVTVSVMILVLIALERHQLIVHPTRWKPSVRQAYIAIIFVWGLALLLAVPMAYVMELTDSIHKKLSEIIKSFSNKYACLEVWPSDQQKRVYSVTILLMQYVVPLCFILCCYLRISVHLGRRESLFGRSYSHMRRVNLMLAFMLGAFALSYLPLQIFNIIMELNHKLIPPCYHDLLFSLCHLISMISTCINPVIYGLLNSNVKQEVKTLVQKCTGKKQRGSTAFDEGEEHPLSVKYSLALPGTPSTDCEKNQLESHQNT